MTNRLFDYVENAFGGTEIMARHFHSHVLPKLKNIQKYKCIILPGYSPDTKTWGIDGMQSIVWLHNTLDQFDNSIVMQALKNRLVQKSIKYIITVSEYHRVQTSIQLDFPLDRIVVIPNAITDISFNKNKFDNINKVKLIHASTASRGMSTLLDAVPLVEEDFELNIFNDFYPDIPNNYNSDGINDPRVNFWGKTPRKTVYKFMAEAHIHAYPTKFVETSCLTQIEALSTGCLTVVTDLGALPETSGGYAKLIPVSQLTPELYAKELSLAINEIKQNGYDFNKQVEYIKTNYSFDKFEENWLKFDSMI